MADEQTEKTEYIEQYVTEETIREDLAEKESQAEIDWEDWTEARGGPKSHDLDILRTPETLQEIRIPIDYQKKKFVTFYIRELTTEEQLKMMEEFYQYHQKSGKATMNFLNFYRSIFRKMVKSTRPKIDWRDARFFNKRFLKILMEYLPSPFDLDSKLDENEAKNLGQLSEVNITTTKRQH